MSPRWTRRALLRTTGTATLAGIAGCGSDGGTPTPTKTTYGVAVHNRMRASDFEESTWLHEPRPARILLIVRDLDPDTDGSFLDETVEVPVGESTTIQDAFTAERDGTTYAMTAKAEPLSEEDTPKEGNLEDTLTFTPEDGERPSANPIPVVITTTNRGEHMRMFPEVTIHETPLEE